MKKINKLLILSIVLLLVTTLVACQADQLSTDNIQKTNLSQNVNTKKVLVEMKEIKKGKQTGGATWEYDKHGRKIKKTLKSKGEVVGTTTWKYDKNDNVIEFHEKGDQFEEWWKKKYDSQGRVIWEDHFKDEIYRSPRRTIYKWEYNKEGQEIKYSRKDADTGEKEITTTEYDDEGRKLLVKKVDGKGKVLVKEEWKYNQAGQETYYQKIDNFIDWTEKKIYKYDENGNKVLAKKHINQSLKYYYKSIYNKEGNRVKLISKDKNGKTIWIEYYKYNPNNKLIEEIRKDFNGKIIRKIYHKYDKKGNEIRYWGTQNGTFDFDWVYKYDENGNKIYYAEKNEKGEVKRWESYEWYPNGQMKMSNATTYPEGRGIKHYDERGNQIRIEFKDKEGKTTALKESEYDEENRLLKETWAEGYRIYIYKEIKIK
ncbi:hypothetical protein U472_13170 [Orenia metallireducens]|uniref:YD repeat-containing protein n=1 Tax=Orenia metallireducens TaxID=1413210 RepID=A0A1C0A587_9FIRM|nr:hypothetical protein [Orenia metallireducens]OCL25302.1 hypothetical protein U472_13170 [Orenia metallireducens]